ncbi:MAG TPA: NAD(P)H-hydrate dehydratase [Chitinophagaceae bacterium]|nr:NAD(P)H-hydrate dehydratase [Chitinophagaceae bacterium]
MKILSAEQIRQWDQFTIEEEPIASIDLMERAAQKCTDWLCERFPETSSFSIFCGKGNNGGDGLAIARQLLDRNYLVSVFILEFGHKGTNDFQINLARLHKLSQADIHFIQTEEHFHSFNKGTIIIDAIYGTGLNRPLEGVTANLVQHINNSGCEIVSIDIPSGLFTDHSSKGNVMIHAGHILTFQCYKPAFFFAENDAAIDQVHLLDIGLHQQFLEQISTNYEFVDDKLVHALYRPRKKFSHKGHFGHALIIAGSYGKIGAAVLATKACLRSGAGLVTSHIPSSGYTIMQDSVPEAMVMTDFNSSFVTKLSETPDRFKAIGIGPGIGNAKESRDLLFDIFNSYEQPLVADADALNLMASEPELLRLLPAKSILTPHPKEFERLFGTTENEFERLEKAKQKSAEFNCVIVLKGHHTAITLPNGTIFFNSTGNPGMATAGSGDVLTGILTGLLAQGYSSFSAAILGVYLHGAAGDLAAKQNSMEAMVAGDIINNLGNAFLSLKD